MSEIALKSSWRWPGKGLLLLTICSSLTSMYLFWGWRTPELERLWALQSALLSGKAMALQASEKRSLQAAFSKWPTLASNTLSGQPAMCLNPRSHYANSTAYVLRTPALKKFRLLTQHPTAYTLKLTGQPLQTDNSPPWQQAFTLAAKREHEIELPELSTPIEWLELTFDSTAPPLELQWVTTQVSPSPSAQASASPHTLSTATSFNTPPQYIKQGVQSHDPDL